MFPSESQWTAALIARHGPELHRRFSSASVAVCGLGGLGSNIAVALARAGIGTLLLIDFDLVDISNLHRQQYKASQTGRYKTEALAENLSEIAPYTKVKTLTAKITEENFAEVLKDADIVCEAFDQPDQKAMLVSGLLRTCPGTTVVSGNGMAGYGDANEIHTRKKLSRLYVCGDESTDVGGGIGLMAPRVAVCAGHQANQVIRLLLGED